MKRISHTREGHFLLWRYAAFYERKALKMGDGIKKLCEELKPFEKVQPSKAYQTLYKSLDNLSKLGTKEMIGFMRQKKELKATPHNCEVPILRKQPLQENLHVLYVNVKYSTSHSKASGSPRGEPDAYHVSSGSMIIPAGCENSSVESGSAGCTIQIS